jgi:hypothetical protein
MKTDNQEKLELNQRTRLRNASLWIPLDWGGLMAPLLAEQAVMNTLAQPGIENPMAVSEEIWGVKEYQRDRSTELDQVKISQDRRIADDKVATGRAKLAIQKAADEYTLAAEFYEASVRSLLMSAREYAALVERKLLAVEASQVTLAIAKEGLHLETVQADIMKEAIKSAMVDAEIAKYKLEVSKANLRALLAAVAAGEAEVKVLETQVQEAMATAEVATLQANVAMIYAEILTKKLSAVKLDVGQKEIAAGFGYIQSKLDDMLALYDTQGLMEHIKTEAEAQIQAEIALILAAEKAGEDLKEQAVEDAQTAFTYKDEQTQTNLEAETTLRGTLVTAEEAMSDAKLTYFNDKEAKQTWAQALINVAHKATYQYSAEYREKVEVRQEFIA